VRVNKRALTITVISGAIMFLVWDHARSHQVREFATLPEIIISVLYQPTFLLNSVFGYVRPLDKFPQQIYSHYTLLEMLLLNCLLIYTCASLMVTNKSQK
jgi:hypothetical protein